MLRIEDNGSGFPETATIRSGMGLQIMRYRAAMIGASLSIQPAASSGTIVTCSIRDGAQTE
jgi:signal transduction histidine kinase